MSSGGYGTTHFHVQHQRAFILGHGTTVLVWPCIQCPCILDEKQFSPLCAGCHGTGRLYPPTQTYSTTLLMHHESSLRAFVEPGTWTDGMIRATVLPEVHLCERDKVIMVDIRDTYNDETLTRGLQDRVRFGSGVALDMVLSLDPGTGGVQVYRQGVDYVLTPPNLVTWVDGGQAPAFAAQYAVKYSAHPEFLVVNDSPRLRVEHRLPQSSEVILLRLDKVTKDLVP